MNYEKSECYGVPVALILFNRPEETARTFETIRKLRPARLLLVADGARPGKAGEREACAEARRITENIDWPCDVLRNFSDVNLGCKRRVSSGIGWVFQQVEEAVILEDDCIADASFFVFCEAMLERYRNDARIMSIAGVNFQFRHHEPASSYYFSRFNHIWGWATWRRAWNLYDPSIATWPRFKKEDLISGIVRRRNTKRFFRFVFDALYNNKIDTWDGQWTYAHFVNRGACIIPKENLVSNIGFGAAGTHTKNAMSRYSQMPAGRIEPPFIEPDFFSFDSKADLYTESTIYNPVIPPALKELIFRFLPKA